MANLGSVQLRAFQVVQELKQHISLEVKPLSACDQVKNSLLILVKLRNYTKLRRLTGRGNILVLDILDTIHLLDQPATIFQKITGSTTKNLLKEVDAAIFCSDKTRKAYQHYFKHPNLCQTIYHHWDSRFIRRPKPSFAQVKSAYFGLPRKAHLAEKLSGIDFHDLRSFNDMKSGVFDQYNAHYIVKPDEDYYQYEPLTKIATAAFAQSPVIAKKDHEQELLTKDYPYYISGMTENDILSVIDKMQLTYQDKEWHEATAIMEDVYVRTSLQQIAQDYLKFINQFMK
ncbi:hypothetical protein [Leucothrix mucor]|uniref:hypothetical protein n=1 Tax=Leucothrix mucor TaxID=45248 RepID=UPI0003B4F7ED|nr:hypothetical protein [Leucothrix mucor]